MVLPAITRRLFMKGIGALAGSKVLPKGLADIAVKEVVKEIPYAPPWVSGMLNALKGVSKDVKGLHGSTARLTSFKAGNDANIINLGSKTVKAYKDTTAKISYFKVKTPDYKLADDASKARGEKYPSNSWDDITLREEPGETTITFQNKEYSGNDQHVIIDKINKETRFVDDNWRMEYGGEDVVKDDWIEYAITPNKNEIALSLKKPLKEIDDAVVDGYSVAGMDEYYADMFRSYVDSFSPSGNIFGTMDRMKRIIRKKDALRLEKIQNDIQVRDLKEKQMAEWEEQFRGGFGMHGYNKGGFVDYGEMKEVVPPLDGYAAGGIGKLVVKQAPKVLNKLREWAPQITGQVAKPQKLKYPWAVFDEAGNPIKDFRLKKDANTWLNQERTATGMSESGFNLFKQYKIGKIKPPPVKPIKPKPTDAPAMFYRSREEIIQGPPIMTGEQWMKFLKARGVRDIEMMDTSLGPWLNQNLKNKVSKNDLVAKFDNIVPDFDVQVTGKDFSEGMSIAKGLQNVDSTVFSPESSKIIRFLQAQTKNISDDKSAKEVMTSLDNLFDNAYGIKNVTTEGIPANNASVPYEIKQVMTDVLSAGRQRGVGMEGSAFVGSPSHGSSQVFGSTSGKNYREFLFNWKPKGPRANEPKYDYAHSFSGAKGENAFMHARVSDRVDEYGNKLIFVEEFQSDMHQPISAALRKAEKEGKKIPKGGRYAPRLDVDVPVDSKANLEQMANIQRQIDRLLETNPRSPKLAKLYEQKDMIRNIETPKIAKGDHSGIPEGPFKNSQDYMEFAIKYLLRVAKDGNYDGVAFSTPAIKNLKMTPGSKDYQGNIIAYGNILKNAIQKAKSKSGADLVETSIGAKVDRQTGHYGSEDVMQYFGVPALMLKGNTKALEKISKGLPAYKDGGLTETIPPEKGPLPYGIFKDVVPTL